MKILGYAEGVVPDNVKLRFQWDHKEWCENRLIANPQSWLNYRDLIGRVLAAPREWHAEENFDLCRQVTMVGWLTPSPLWKLPVPFVWGESAGQGESKPAAFDRPLWF